MFMEGKGRRYPFVRVSRKVWIPFFFAAGSSFAPEPKKSVSLFVNIIIIEIRRLHLMSQKMSVAGDWTENQTAGRILLDSTT